MELTVGTTLTDLIEERVNRVMVLDTTDTRYLLGECYHHPEHGRLWHDYWVTHEEMDHMIEHGEAEIAYVSPTEAVSHVKRLCSLHGREARTFEKKIVGES